MGKEFVHMCVLITTGFEAVETMLIDI